VYTATCDVYCMRIAPSPTHLTRAVYPLTYSACTQPILHTRRTLRDTHTHTHTHTSRSQLGQGDSAAFTETWSLLDYEFPAAGTDVDLESLTAVVGGLAPVVVR
jgi:hypothetical protein